MNFGYNSTVAKRKSMTSRTQKISTKILVNLFKFSLYLIVLVTVVVGFAGIGMVKGIIDNSPEVDSLSIAPSGYATTIYDADGNLITKLVMSGSNRQEISINDMPECLQYAFIDIEDERFEEHNGIDIKGIFRAAFVALTTRDLSEGASTITQQLLKNNVFENGGAESNYGALFKRKLQEQYLALQLEKTMPKSYILQSYLNTINLGSNCLGVQAAAKRYFNKDAKDLNISESAVIAAITQSPYTFNPVLHPEENASRRKKVLKNMLKNGHITQDEYEEAMADDVYSRIQTVNTQTVTTTTAYSYFTDALIDDVLNDLQEQRGYTRTQAYNLLYGGGLTIYTTQDPTIQAICDEEVNNPDNYPMATSYSINWAWSVQLEDETVQNYSDVDLEYFNRVTLQNPSFKMIFSSTEEADQYIAAFKAEFLKEGQKELAETLVYTLQPQTSFTVMDQKTGYVKAIVGGRGEKSASLTLNRATDTTRQPGSCFKVLAAYAPAIDTAGYTLASVIEDAPFNDINGRPVSNWWGNSYRGLQSCREGIKQSMNIVTSKLLTAISPQLGYDYVEQFGITTLVSEKVLANGSVVSDVGQALALGGITYGVTNLELCAAYASIANSGVYNKPVLYTKVLDHEGKVLIESNTSPKTVIKDSTAFLLTSAMEDVVKSGTGTACQVSGMSVSGKTGTTTNDNDLWFAGYTPYLTATIWTGYDENKKIPNTSYHEYLWSKIVTRIDNAKGYTEDPGFPVPDSVTQVQVCAKSGQLPIAGVCDHDPEGSKVITEYFAKGTEPTSVCTIHHEYTLCSASGLLATSNCPSSAIVKKVYRVTGSSSNTWDTPYTVPSSLNNSYCPVHGKTNSPVSAEPSTAASPTP